jgi:hypothetical protein
VEAVLLVQQVQLILQVVPVPAQVLVVLLPLKPEPRDPEQRVMLLLKMEVVQIV